MWIEQIKSSVERVANSWIDMKINSLVSQIEGEFKFKWNTLNNLFSFKLTKWQEETKEDSQEFRNALIAEIQRQANAWEIYLNNSQDLSEKQYEALASKIIEIKKLTKEIQSWIEELRSEMLNKHFEELKLTANDLTTRWWYSPKLLERIENPKNLADQLMWILVWIVETSVVLWRLWYDLWKWIVLAIYHLIEIIGWKGKLDTNVKI